MGGRRPTPAVVGRRGCAVLGGLLVALGLAVAGAPPAQAHTRTQETTNVVSRLVSAPSVPGVEWTVHTGGFLVEVVNRSDVVIVVAGYDGEPYLRIGPDGVEHNRRSPATYVNQDRYGDVAVPPAADAAAPPEWVLVSDEPRAVWHDHRTHWMSRSPPPVVGAGALARAAMQAELVGPIGRAGPRSGEAFQAWSIPVLAGDEPGELAGELVWQDPPSVRWWALLAVVLVAPALTGLRRSTAAGVTRPAALVVALVAAANLIHLVDDLVAWPRHPLDELFGVLHTLLFLGAGLGGALWALRARSGRLLALGIASGAVLYHQGLVHLGMLAASSFPTVWPPAVVRLTVLLGLVQVVPVGLVILRARQVTDRAVRSPGDADLAPAR